MATNSLQYSILYGLSFYLVAAVFHALASRRLKRDMYRPANPLKSRKSGNRLNDEPRGGGDGRGNGAACTTVHDATQLGGFVMTKWILAAGAAALAITSPVLAERGGQGGDKGKGSQQAAKADKGRRRRRAAGAKADRGGDRSAKASRRPTAALTRSSAARSV